MDDYPNNNLDERLRILKMVEQGKITASQGAELLSALGHERPTSQPERKQANRGARWFRIKVSDVVTGKSKTSVNIPMGLVDWGLRIGAQFAPEADIDMEELSQMIQTGIEGKIIDVVDEEDGEHVEIFVE
jgi:hypothetical protein